MVKKLLLSAVIFFNFLISKSQEDFKVELKDSETNEPVSFATIKFKDSNRGIVADYYGQFRLPYTNKSGIPILVISALGYESIEVNPIDLDFTVVNSIKMRAQIENLEAVFLNVSKKNVNKKNLKSLNRVESIIKEGRKMLAVDIVNTAIKNIPINLDSRQHAYIGYYRDYQYANNQYYNLNEGILEQFDSGIDTDKISDSTNNGVFYSFNQNKDFATNKTYALQYDGLNKFIENAQIRGFRGNELSILNVHNPIRNYNTYTFSYVYQLNKDFIKNHSFKKSKVYLVDSIPVIDIIFSTRKQRKPSYFSQSIAKPSVPKMNMNRVAGILTIALTDFSIYRFDYAMYDYKDSNPLFNVNIEYRKENGKMYLNYISFNNRFEVAEDFTFSTGDIIFNKKDFTFKVAVNSDLDINTVKKRNFRVKFNGERIAIKSANAVDKRNIKIKINDYKGSLDELSEEDLQFLNFLIKDMKDSQGREIYKTRTITAYQFREYFVQEVFNGKTMSPSLQYIAKTKPLKEAPVNYSLGNKEAYIISSPLQKRRLKAK